MVRHLAPSSFQRPASRPRPCSQRPWPKAAALVALCAHSLVAAAQPNATELIDGPTAAPVVETLSLSVAIQRFQADSPTTAQLSARVAQARAQAHLATAPLQPVVALRGGYTRNSDEAIISLGTLLDSLASALPGEVTLDPALFPPDFIIQPLDQWTAGATVKVPILQPVAWSDLGVARKAVEATAAATQDVALQAEAGLVKAAWLASAAEESVSATRRGVQAAQAHGEAAKRRLDAGVGTQLEVLQADTERVRRQSDWVQAVAQLDQAHRALGALLGVDGPVDVEVPPLDSQPSLRVDLDGLTHPRLVAAEAATAAAERQIHSALWRHSPTLDGTATAYASDVEYVTGEKSGWRLGLELTWVLYDGGARYGMLDRARAQRAQAAAQAQQTRLDLGRAGADARAGIDVARQRLRLAEEGLSLATEAEATAGRLYETGLVSGLDLLDAQQRRTDADLAVAGGHAQLAAAVADAAVASGRHWEQVTSTADARTVR